MQRVGIVGLGNIGTPVASNLLAAGLRVKGFDLVKNLVFVQEGGEQVDALGALADCEIIIQSLPSVEALEQTTSQLLPHLDAGKVIVDMSSYALDAKRTAAERVYSTGAAFLDCEVSGLPFQVAAKTAVLFVAGSQKAAARCGLVFDASFSKVFFLGDFGAATKMKLIANYMVCAHNLIGAEALTLGKAAGLDPKQMVEVLGPSAAGSTTFTNKAPLMVSREFDKGRGPFRHMFGYLDRAYALAEGTGVASAMQMLERVRNIYAVAREQQRHDQDIAGIIEVIAPQG